MNKCLNRILICAFFLTSLGATAQNQTEIKDIIKEIWSNKKVGFADGIRAGLESEKTVILYDTQERTMNLLVYAHNTKDYALLDEIASLYLVAYDYLVPITEKKILQSSTSFVILCEFQFQTQKKIWKNLGSRIDGYENIVESAQFLYAISRTLHYALLVPENERNNLPVLNEFISKYTPIVIEHYNRWLTEDLSFQEIRSSNCNSTCYNHVDFLERKLNYEFGDTNPFCNTVKDSDLMIVAGIAEMLVGNKINASLIPISEAVKTRFANHVDLGTRVLQNRLVENPITLVDFKGQPVKGLIYEPNTLASHVDYNRAGNIDPTCPPDLASVESVCVDISHYRRMVHILETLYTNRHITGQLYPTIRTMEEVSNQFIYGVFNKDFQKPLFSNYSDGKNGWYRYGRNNSAGNAPYELSVAGINGGYNFWSKYNSDYKQVRDALWEMILSSDSNIAEHVKDYYIELYNLSCGRFSDTSNRDFRLSNALTHSKDILMFLPTYFPVPEEVNETLLMSVNCDTDSFIYRSDSEGMVDREVYDSTFWNITDMTSGDFNGDGDDEVLSAYTSTGGVAIYRSEDANHPGGGSLAQLVFNSSNHKIISMTSGDFDGDGDDELVTAFKSSSEFYIYKSEDANYPGGGMLSELVFNSSSHEIIDLTSGDYDGDGDDELLTAFRSSGVVSIYKSEDAKHPGGGPLSTSVYSNTFWDIINMASGDFDGDGDDELLTAFTSTGGDAIYKSEDGNNPGGGPLSTTVYTSTHWNVETMGVRDFDSDGDDELLTALRSTTEVAIYKSEDANHPGGGINSHKIYKMDKNCSVNAIVSGKFGLDEASKFKRTRDNNLVKEEVEGVEIYPNPGIGELNVKSLREPIQQIEVYDIQGRKIPIQIEGSSKLVKKLRLGNGNIRSGAYIVKVLFKNKVNSKIFIVK